MLIFPTIGSFIVISIIYLYLRENGRKKLKNKIKRKTAKINQQFSYDF